MSGPRRVEIAFTTNAGCWIDAPRAPGHEAAPPLLVCLHGQGQDGERQRRWMADAVPPHFAAAFPDGFHTHEVRRPERPIRLGHAWYLFTGDQDEFAKSLVLAEEALWRLVDVVQATLGTDPERLYLAGFSQGGYLVHCAAVRAPDRVAGWIGQSSRLKHEFLQEELPRVAGKPVLLQHGEQDASLDVERARESAAILREHGAEVELALYDAGHSITPAMVADIRTWLEAHEPAER